MSLNSGNLNLQEPLDDLVVGRSESPCGCIHSEQHAEVLRASELQMLSVEGLVASADAEVWALCGPAS